MRCLILDKAVVERRLSLVIETRELAEQILDLAGVVGAASIINNNGSVPIN